MKLQIILLSFCFVIASLINAQEIEDFLDKRVSAINIEGNIFLSQQEIFRNIVLESEIDQGLDLLKVENDLKSILALGYFENVDVFFSLENDAVQITYQVDENPRIENIEILGATAFSHKEIIALLESKKNKILNFNFIESDLKAINKLYQDEGYDYSEVKNINFDKKTSTLKITIQEIIIDEIIITGNQKIAKYIIKRELETKPGSVYNFYQLRRDRYRLLALGYFSDVAFPQLTSGNLNQVEIRVLEQKFNSLNFGAGFSEGEPWFVFLGLGFKNIFNSGSILNLYTEIADTSRSYKLDYFYPWLFNIRLDGQLSFWNILDIEKLVEAERKINLDVSRQGSSIKLSYPITDKLNTIFILRSENISSLDKDRKVKYNNTSIINRFLYDDIFYNDFLRPVKGKMLNISMEHGGKVFDSIDLGGVDFSRYDFSISSFFPLVNSHNILATRFLAGSYLAKDDTKPILEGDQYTAGGSMSLRGIVDGSNYLRIGPNIMLLNMEYRYSFNEFFQIVAFIDTGDTFLKDDFNLNRFRFGRGLGVRFNFSGLIVRLDYAQANDYKYFPDGSFKYTKDRDAIHFSLGQMF